MGTNLTIKKGFASRTKVAPVLEKTINFQSFTLHVHSKQILYLFF